MAMNFLGLSDLMFNENKGLMRKHPGVYRLRKCHKKAIDKAYKKFYEKYPNAKAGFSKKQLTPHLMRTKNGQKKIIGLFVWNG